MTEFSSSSKSIIILVYFIFFFLTTKRLRVRNIKNYWLLSFKEFCFFFIKLSFLMAYCNNLLRSSLRILVLGKILTLFLFFGTYLFEAPLLYAFKNLSWAWLSILINHNYSSSNLHFILQLILKYLRGNKLWLHFY